MSDAAAGDTSRRHPTAWGERIVVAALLILFAGLTIHSMARHNATFYETAHLAAGIAYAQSGDFRMNVEQPALPKLLAGFAASASGVRLPEGGMVGDPSDPARVWAFAHDVLYEGAASWRRLMFLGRLPSVGMTTLLGLLLWWWTRAMAGPAVAVAALALFAFCPNILAHASLVNADMPLALCVTAIAACLWQARRTSEIRWIAAAGACFGVSVVTNFAAFAYLPAWALLAAWPSATRTPRSGVVHVAALAVLGLVFAEALVFVCYGGHVQWTSAGVPWTSADFARGLRDAMRGAEALHPAYLLGGTVDRAPWWWPFATLSFKASLPLVLLAGFGVVHVVRQRADRTADLLFLAVPIAATLVVNAWASDGTGVRHLLPMFPFLMMFAAWFLRSGRPNSRIVTLGGTVLLGWHVGGAIAAHPHYLPFFNELARANGGGDRLLGDSDLDWGQDLSLASARLRERGVSQAILGYFGSANPFTEEIEWQLLPPSQRPKDEDPWNVLPTEGDQWLVVSTTNRQGIYYRAPDGGPPYRFLEGVPPVEWVGNGSIGIWEIGRNADVQRGLAEIYLRHNLTEEAEGALRRAIAKIAYDSDSRYRLARLLRSQGELARADSVIVAGPNPDVSMLLEWTSLRREMNDGVRTEIAFETAMRGFPEDPRLKSAYASWLAETGQDLDRALKLADDAVRVLPGSSEFLRVRALVHRQRGDADAALVDLERAVTVAGEDSNILRWDRVLALAAARRIDEALEQARTLAAREDLEPALQVEIEQWIYEVGG